MPKVRRPFEYTLFASLTLIPLGRNGGAYTRVCGCPRTLATRTTRLCARTLPHAHSPPSVTPTHIHTRTFRTPFHSLESSSHIQTAGAVCICLTNKHTHSPACIRACRIQLQTPAYPKLHQPPLIISSSSLNTLKKSSKPSPKSRHPHNVHTNPESCKMPTNKPNQPPQTRL